VRLSLTAHVCGPRIGTAPQLAAALVAHAPRIVVIGLSLANEGLINAETEASAQAIRASYLLGLGSLIDQAEQAGDF
jgi:hypothetical protein